jgi:hypothetical protein
MVRLDVPAYYLNEVRPILGHVQEAVCLLARFEKLALKAGAQERQAIDLTAFRGRLRPTGMPPFPEEQVIGKKLFQGGFLGLTCGQRRQGDAEFGAVRFGRGGPIQKKKRPPCGPGGRCKR